MKNICSRILAIAILAATGTGVLLLPGRMSIAEAATAGATIAVIGVIAPTIVAWIKKLLTHN